MKNFKKWGLMAAVVGGLLTAFIISNGVERRNKARIAQYFVPVGTFVSADHQVSVLSNAGENRFSVATLSGKMIVELVDEETLRKHHPKLYEQLKTGLAKFTEGEIWAGNDIPAPNARLDSIHFPNRY